MSEQVWQRDENWLGTEIDDSFVMINIDTGKYVSLNSSANAVWAALEQPRTREEIEAELHQRYAVKPDQCREAVGKLLTRMRELQLAAPR